ncbi:hypothetical protein [Bryocella elongata]|uniref:hypothetical protein n=1 Tax=Bryocella elongata TaxID=863522 RepID=UPI0011B06D36|nr:hypothetical protein [Bryocella elongata]
MTVCIASFANHEEQICVVSDSKAAFGDFSTDKGAIKHEHLGNGHIVLIAGNDVVFASPTIQRARKRIAKDSIKDSDETAEILYEELCKTQNRVIEAKVLSKYGLTVEQFVNKGRKSFTDQVFYEICSRIDRENLSLQFLVAGFDTKNKPHIRIVSAGEPPHDFDSMGFAAIGSGAPAALASLSFAADHHGFCRYSDMDACAYHLYAAKFMSESATDVGRDTFFLSVGKQGTYSVHLLAEEAIRKAWLKDGAPRHSQRTIKILHDALYPTEKFLDAAVLARCLKYGDRTLKKLYGLILTASRRKASQTTVPTTSSSLPRTLEGQK